MARLVAILENCGYVR